MSRRPDERAKSRWQGIAVCELSEAAERVDQLHLLALFYQKFFA
jgi:hypothetical protein